MWDNKPDAPEGIRGEFKSIDTNVAGIQVAETFPKFAQVMDKSTIVRSLYHTIPSHGPAAVFMTTGNKPTAALQYPALGSIAAKTLKTEVGVPPYVTFGDIRAGAVGQAGYLGTGYNPFIIEGGAPTGARRGNTNGGFSVRGLTLKGTFTLEDLEKRDALLASSTAASQGSTSRTTWWTVSTPSINRRSKSSRATRPARRST